MEHLMSDVSLPGSIQGTDLSQIHELKTYQARDLAIRAGRKAANDNWLLSQLISLWLESELDERSDFAELIAASVEAFEGEFGQWHGSVNSARESALSSPLERLSALHRISQSATASLDLDSMLTTVVRVVRETLGCDACSIFLFDPSSDTLVLRASIGLNPGAVGRVTLPLGAGITGEAALKREVVAVIDAVSHPSYVDYPLLGDQPYFSHVSAPLALRSPDRLIGVLNLMTIERRAFVEEEVAFIETAAGEIAMAIENALLYSETDAELHNRISQLSTLRQMSRLVASTLDLPQVLELVSRQAAELTRGLAVEIYKDNPDDEKPPELLSHYGAGEAVLTERVRREVRSMVGDVVGALGTVERSIEIRPGERLEVMALPMLTGRRAVGAICVYSEQHLGDDPEFHGMLHAFSDSAAIAIENAELYDEARRGWQRTSALLQEMHHRVRNNLQTVAALLSMQARHASSAEATVPLHEAVGRIRSIAAIHDVLSSGSISETTVGVIAKHVTDEASMTILPPDKDIRFDINADDVWVSSREATVLALLINEFVSNAFVHGFSDRSRGRIEIIARTADQLTIVEVNDNGEGVPVDFDPGDASGLGLQIARTLTESDLNGSLSISRRDEGGTAVRVTFLSRRLPEETDA
jgi:two-component system, sensor histidine kinase PdtaS